MKRALGVDIGGTAVKLAIVNEEGALEAMDSIASEGGAAEFVGRIAAAARTLIGGGNVSGAGVAVAGLLDETRGVMTFNPNLPWLEGFPLRAALQDALGLRVVLEVDSNAAAFGEYLHGAGRGASRLLCLSVGTGLGGAMMVEGALMRLAHQCIGDPGHVLLQPGGPRCSVGCRGCAEALVSAPALERRAAGMNPENPPTAREIVEAAQGGDARAIAALAETGRWLGLAIGSLAPIFFPDRVVIAGGVAEAGELLLGPATLAFEENAGEFYRRGVEIRKAELGARAGVAGAASLASLS